MSWAKRFVLFHNMRHPKYMGAKEIEEFLTHLAVEGNVALSTMLRFRMPQVYASVSAIVAPPAR